MSSVADLEVSMIGDMSTLVSAESHLKIGWRPLDTGELDHERLWLGLGVVGCGLIAGGLHMGMQPPPCLFHWITGVPCPGCGSTRAVLQLVQGHLGAAFAFNPLTTLATLAAVVWGIYALVVLAFRLPRLRVEAVSRASARGLRAAVVVAVCMNWWWVIAHGL